MSDRSETVRDLVTYVLRVWLAGLAAAVFVPVAVAAAALDLLAGRGRADGLLGRVLDASASAEAALDVHGARTEITLAREPEARPRRATAAA